MFCCFCQTCKIPRKVLVSKTLGRRHLEAQRGFTNIILCWTGLPVDEGKMAFRKGYCVCRKLDPLSFSVIVETMNREECLLSESGALAILFKQICCDNYFVRKVSDLTLCELFICGM